MPGTPVGSLACQVNTKLQRLVTRVLSCSKTPPAPGKGKKSASPGEETYDIICEDSVLFPEGGGQPCDLGSIASIPVVGVVRQGDTCVIRTATPIEVGAEVEQVVDWPRRFDHMQHHTGQHLLTALMESMLRIPTESWALSYPTCYLQLPVATVPQDDLDRVEEACNALIRSGVSVTTQTFESRASVPAARSRGIPADVTGPIRIVTIGDGVDSCTCCGTHLGNLAELQCVKLLHTEPKAGTCRLHFVFGNRVIAHFGDMYARERQLQKELGLPPPHFLEGVQRCGKEANALLKSKKKLLEEVAALSAPNVVADAAAPLLQSSSTPPLPFLYLREDADMDFIATIATALQSGDGAPAKSRVCILACGSLTSTACDGAFMIVGPSTADITAFAEQRVIPGLAGKGGLTKQGFRGKCDLRLWKAFSRSIATEAA